MSYDEHLISQAGGDRDACRCWTEPARVHGGHCCMATAGQTCHETEGLTAHQEGTR